MAVTWLRMKQSTRISKIRSIRLKILRAILKYLKKRNKPILNYLLTGHQNVKNNEDITCGKKLNDVHRNTETY